MSEHTTQGVSESEERWQRLMDVGLRYKRERDQARQQLHEMTLARDLCKRQTAEVDELRQWQVSHAEVALKAIEAHGQNGVWTAEDCATHATGALKRMQSPVGSVPAGMQEPPDA